MVSGPDGRLGVLVAGGGAAWEGRAVDALATARPGVVLLRRCLDVTELLAAATTGAAAVAVVSAHLPGLDADAVAQLGRLGTRVLAVGDGPASSDRLQRIGVAAVLPDVTEAFVAAVRDVARTQGPASVDATRPENPQPVVSGEGRVVAVWGPHGSTGRTTLAVGIAAASAGRRVPTLLLDADPYGGAVAQHLGVTDEVSGLLAAARSANAGLLDAGRLAGLARQAGPGLRLLTGLPRPDRWREIRAVALEELVSQSSVLEPLVVIDAGPGLETGEDTAPSRDALVTTTVTSADVVVAVAAADPVSLARAARALADLEDVRPGGAAYVVVNRWRPGAGWSQADVRDMLFRVAPAAEVVFVPEDRAAADRALMTGSAVTEGRSNALSCAIEDLAGRIAVGTGEPVRPPRLGRRRPRRGRAQTVRSR